MTHIKKFSLSVIFIMVAMIAYAESSYDISEIYSVIETPSGSKAVSSYGKPIDVKYILSPTNVDTGKYVVEVKKIADNLYRIKDTDICVETRYCHKWASFSTKVVLIISSNYGYTKGKIIFD